MYSLRLLGGMHLEGPAGAVGAVATRRRPLALLAALAVAGRDGLTRHQAAALLWGDIDDKHALRSLSEALYALRVELGPDAIRSTATGLAINDAVIEADVATFLGALRRGDRVAAVAAYSGPFLDGVHIPEAQAFAEWVDGVRGRLAGQFTAALERLATDAGVAGDHVAAVTWWRRLADEDRLNSRLAMELARALAHTGDRGNALQQLQAHVRELHAELGAAPDAAVLTLLDELRTGSAAPAARDRRAYATSGGTAERPGSVEEPRAQVQTLATPSGGATPTRKAPTNALERLPRWAMAAAVAGVALVALAATQLFTPRPLDITASDITPVTSDAGIEYQPAVSPDGNDVAYVAGPLFAPHLFVRGTGDLSGSATIAIGDTTLASEWFPTWSPDGQSVRFWGCAPGATPDLVSGCAWMESVRLGGTSREASLPRRVMRMRALGYSLAWSLDGARVAFASSDTIFTISAADSGLHLVTVRKNGFPYSLAWSPDGQFLAYCTGNVFRRLGVQSAESSVWIVPAAGGEPRQVAGGNHFNASPAWLDARHLLFVSDRDGERAVYAVEVGRRGNRSAPRIIPGLSDPHSISYAIGSRKLAYARFTVRQNIWSYPLGRPAPISIRDGRPVTTSNQVIETHDLSPDGAWIVYDGNLRGHMDLYRVPSGGGQAVPLTSGPTGGQAGRWSADGRDVVFQTPWGRTNQIMVMSAQGGAAVALTPPGEYGYPSWSPNGLSIAFQSRRSGSGPYKAWLVSRDSVGGPWHEAVQLTDSSCHVPDWAPDGRTLACVGGPTRLRLVTVPSGRTVNSDLLTANHLRANSVPRFSRDGRTIFASAVHEDGRQGIWAVPRAGGQARLVVAFDDPAGPPAWIWVSVGPDRLYLTVSQYESDIWVAKLNW